MPAFTWRGLPALALALAAATHAGGSSAACRSIQFERGASAAHLQGTAPAEDFDCLRFSTGAGQDVQLSIRSARDAVAFTVVGVADDRDSLRFRSTKKTYELRVFQTLKAAAPVKYELSLSIR